MTSHKLVIVVVFIVIGIIILYANAGSGFYDGAVFDYTMPTVFDTKNPNIYYENGMAVYVDKTPFIGWTNSDLKLSADTMDVLVLRQAAELRETKKRGAHIRGMIAERNMKREAAIKIAAEREAAILRAMANSHEAAAKSEAEMARNLENSVQTVDKRLKKLAAVRDDERYTETNGANRSSLKRPRRTILMN
jgi:hypothetical protein